MMANERAGPSRLVFHFGHTTCDVTLCFPVWSTGGPHQKYVGMVYVWMWVVKMHILGPQNQESESLAMSSGSLHF